MQYILRKINYEEIKRLVCDDLKVIAILSGLQLDTPNVCAITVSRIARIESNTIKEQFVVQEVL